jgi:serine/threonine protein kinase
VTSEEWQRIRAIFDAASGLSPAERAAYLNRACGSDSAIKDEVTSLLDAHDRADLLLERSAHQVAAHLLAEEPSSLTGCRVGPYIVRHEIGRGGMGVVYLAEDTRLSRRVALKAITSGTWDPQQRDRVRQEARAAAALSHAGIATFYAIEEIDNELYLVSEYVAGVTLRTLIERGPQSAPQLLDIATQLAVALAAAHAQGIVHRDLKPENIVRTGAGVVKILDFGIALIENAIGPDLYTSGRAVVGTPAYMSPQQRSGEKVDFRTDLFAFGLIVHEMASGSPPTNAARSTSTTAAAVRNDPPPFADAAIDRVVARCLGTLLEKPYGSTQELVRDLEHIARQQPPEPDGPQDAGRRDRSESFAGSRASALWWWQFHQCALSVIYVLTVYPTWRARVWLPQPAQLLFFFAILAPAAAATTMRSHLWFSARSYATELAAQRRRAVPWIRRSDLIFCLTLFIGAVAIGADHSEVAALLLALSISVAVAAALIEPATTRAAFREDIS